MKDRILREGCTLLIEFVEKHGQRGVRIKMNGAPADWDESTLFEFCNGDTVTINLPPMIVDQELK